MSHRATVRASPTRSAVIVRVALTRAAIGPVVAPSDGAVHVRMVTGEEQRGGWCLLERSVALQPEEGRSLERGIALRPEEGPICAVEAAGLLRHVGVTRRMAFSGRIPRLIVDRSAVLEMALSAADGYVLSRIDGETSEQEVAASTGLSESAVGTSLKKLVALGAIELCQPGLHHAPMTAGSSGTEWHRLLRADRRRLDDSQRQPPLRRTSPAMQRPRHDASQRVQGPRLDASLAVWAPRPSATSGSNRPGRRLAQALGGRLRTTVAQSATRRPRRTWRRIAARHSTGPRPPRGRWWIPSVKLSATTRPRCRSPASCHRTCGGASSPWTWSPNPSTITRCWASSEMPIGTRSAALTSPSRASSTPIAAPTRTWAPSGARWIGCSQR